MKVYHLDCNAILTQQCSNAEKAVTYRNRRLGNEGKCDNIDSAFNVFLTVYFLIEKNSFNFKL